jgi:pimeloyl-ACP methyl ester carboxylesterase
MADLTPDSVSTVFLTGGATRMPSVRKSIAAVVERAGHFLPEDAPETLAQLIANFVRAESEVSQ